MRQAIQAFLDILTREQRERACLAFDDHLERVDWAYYPRRSRGVALAELDHRQQKAAQRLLESGLSAHAYVRARQVMAVEDILDSMELRRISPWRDPALYYVTVFVDGSQLFEPIRGWRFEGHHISLNYSFTRDGLAAASPLFLGSNPAQVSHEGYDILRPLGDAEDLARALLDALSPAQRAKAVVHAAAPGDMVLADLPFVRGSEAAMSLPIIRQMVDRGVSATPFDALRFDPAHPLGIAAGDLTAGQRELLTALVAHYESRYPAGAAWPGFADTAEMHFAWAGPGEVGAPHYYRLQSPALVVEYDNTQNGANHVHTVARHPENDFGLASLGLHHMLEHAN
jgi:hypothetical protein